MKYVDVILPLSLEGTYSYKISDELARRCSPGMRLLVPFQSGKTYAALAVSLSEEKPRIDESKLKEVLAVLDEHPILLPGQLNLWQWIAAYYMCAIGNVFNAALPHGLKAETTYKPKTETYVRLSDKYRNPAARNVAMNVLRNATRQSEVLRTYLELSHWDEPDAEQGDIKEVSREELMNVTRCSSAMVKKLIERGILDPYDKEVGRLNTSMSPHPENIHPLSEAQQQAYEAIREQWKTKNVVLLHGVTSSGKTEIYIHLIQETLAAGKQVLYLLPEIALTVQMMERLQRVFGSRLGIYHSGYSDAERVEIWQKQLSADPYDVILGARSAVFLPFQRLGLVIVDEEHETSFKQQDPAPRYHARSVAIVLARREGAKTLLGTATPSVESYYNTGVGKYGLVTLVTRFRNIELPKIEVVDIKDLRRRKMMSGPFSPRLLHAVREALSDGRQAILFRNRRGFTPMVECRICGWVPKCKHCDVSLTLHKRLNMLTCHYCGYTEAPPATCPNCGNPNLSGRGYGTEQIEDRVGEFFPEARVARMDLDTTRTRNAYERLISDFSHGKTDLLIGTQMISKGLDFDRVAVVGILDADSMLAYPDFRATEHAFMMMCQVSGRAGRKGRRGEVILQTRDADLPLIRQVVNNDYQAFYEQQLGERQLFRYPPFYHLIYVFLKHKNEQLAEMAAQEMGGLLRRQFGERVLGPDKPPVARIKTMFIRKIVLKFENGHDLWRVRQSLKQMEQYILKQKGYSQLQIFFDVDPL